MVILDVVRAALFAVFAYCGLVALTSWAIDTRRLDPFGRTGQLARRMSDPVLRPLERWLVRRGGNPRQAGWWLAGGSVVGGIVVMTVTQWILVQAVRVASIGVSGPRDLIRLAVYYGSQLVSIALIARVIGSWFGVGRYNRWMRPAYLLTDWIVRPLDRIVPNVGMGMIDITPLVAWLLVQLVASQLIRVL